MLATGLRICRLYEKQHARTPARAHTTSNRIRQTDTRLAVDQTIKERNKQTSQAQAARARRKAARRLAEAVLQKRMR
jgi:hypothetical protein